KEPEEAIRQGELKIAYNGKRFVFDYFGSTYPLQPRSYQMILEAHTGKTPEAVRQLVEQLPKPEEKTTYATQWEEFLQQLSALQKNKTIKNFIDKCITKVNADPELVQKIADDQSYRLCNWQETDHRINYRRFFTVNGLICLNIQ